MSRKGRTHPGLYWCAEHQAYTAECYSLHYPDSPSTLGEEALEDLTSSLHELEQEYNDLRQAVTVLEKAVLRQPGSDRTDFDPFQNP